MKCVICKKGATVFPPWKVQPPRLPGSRIPGFFLSTAVPPHACEARVCAGAVGSGMRRRIVHGPGISAAGNNEVMGGGCGELEGVQTKKGAGVWPAVISSGLWLCDHHRYKPRIVEGDRRRGRAVQ